MLSILAFEEGQLIPGLKIETAPRKGGFGIT
jgi:hypothetical protein